MDTPGRHEWLSGGESLGIPLAPRPTSIMCTTWIVCALLCGFLFVCNFSWYIQSEAVHPSTKSVLLARPFWLPVWRRGTCLWRSLNGVKTLPPWRWTIASNYPVDQCHLCFDLSKRNGSIDKDRNGWIVGGGFGWRLWASAFTVLLYKSVFLFMFISVYNIWQLRFFCLFSPVNRRMDEWVSVEQLDLLSEEADSGGGDSEGGATGRYIFALVSDFLSMMSFLPTNRLDMSDTTIPSGQQDFHDFLGCCNCAGLCCSSFLDLLFQLSYQHKVEFKRTALGFIGAGLLHLLLKLFVHSGADILYTSDCY